MNKQSSTSKERERLTDAEQALMGEYFTLCPDCGSGPLYGGPCGGGSQNVACMSCGSEFNVMMPFGVERISDKGPRDLGDRAELYKEMF